MTDESSRPARPWASRFLNADNGVLPLVSVAGARGKSTVSWMLTGILKEAGKPSASWLSSGVYVDEQLQDGELGPWSRVVLAAKHREIAVAIQEMNAATVVAAGLPEASYPIAILTTLCGNSESCLLHDETALERRALEIVARSIRRDGTVVANADDYDIVEIALRSQSEPIMFALHPDSPALQRHLAAGGSGVWVESGQIVAGGTDDGVPIVAVAEIPATLDGAILFQVQNALAATGAALAVGVSPPQIALALRRYTPAPDRQPAASNIVTYNESTIIIDAPRQITSLRMLARGIRHKPRRRTLVVSGSFPGLPDDDVHEAGRILGSLGGIVLLHGEHSPVERMEIIKDGIAAAAVPPIVLSVPDELRAIDHLLNTVAPDDVALVIADDAQDVLTHLWPAPVISIGSIKRAGAASHT